MPIERAASILTPGSSRSCGDPPAVDDAAQRPPVGQAPVDPGLERARKDASPLQRLAEGLANEDRLDCEVVAEGRDQRGDLHHLATDALQLATGDVVTVKMHHEIE